MVHPLYWVTAMIFAVVRGILYIDEQKHLPTVITLQDIAFRKMMQWNIFFCLQDVFWGMMAGEYLGSPKGLMLASTIFHLSTVCTTYY